jgi:deoxyribonuclease-1
MGIIIRILTAILLSSACVFASAENITLSSFSGAKKKLEKHVYLSDSERVTLYCEAAFDENKNITLPAGFVTTKHKKRASRVEWEHVVPAENFGRHFPEWREGHAQCVNSKGKAYKGRRCANKMNNDYKLMQADMYNLYPAIGAVNARRSNYNFAMLGNVENSFGRCAMKVSGTKVEPPAESRGTIARAYLYMDKAYSRYSMSRQQKQLMNAWHRTYPVEQWECQRAKRIQNIQGNENMILKQSCQAAGF